ncbi:MAG: hypothetical protein IJF72_02665 [Clostridia bacterium]|nr:hypothetical protein [Clostridia bacterium]
MKYLAFDIEAANGYKLYSICSIGVVVADENFNVLHSTNIWINPKCKYNLNGTRQNVGIDLKLDKQLLDKSPDFPLVYQKIKDMLEDDDVVVLGHAVDSDVRMLNAACNHYRLPPINFKFICSQLLYKMYKGEKEVKALNKIAVELGLEFSQHNSESDAWMSLQTLKFLIETTQLSLSQLLKKYQIRIGENNDFELTRSVSLLETVSKKHVTAKALEKVKDVYYQTQAQNNKLKSAVFGMARSYELTSFGQELAKKIAQNGGRYSTYLKRCNFYISAEEPSAVDVLREKRVEELQNEKLLTILTLEEFDKMVKGE